tara:strand:+ start:2047 stop:2505 length:459 start_codon:yes stop_codon:yes gene_type:complete
MVLKYISYLSLCIALVILADFLVTKTVITESIIDKTTKHQSYNNAGGNSHVSKAIKTNTLEFSCSDNFYDNSDIGNKVEIKTSFIFNKVNAYENLNTKVSETYSLRYLTGLILPLFVLAVFILSFKFKNHIAILIVVSQLAILVDLLVLIFS